MVRSSLLLLAAVLVTLGGCASDVDVPPSRGISQDIEATRQLGPTSLRPGQSQRNLPATPAPWRNPTPP